MMNCPVTEYLAALHREELLREAEHERLVRAATARATSPVHRLLYECSRYVLVPVRHTAHGQATWASASPAVGTIRRQHVDATRTNRAHEASFVHL